MSINKVILIGNLGQDPEIKYMSNSDAVTNISIATSKKWKDKNTGEQKENTQWHRLVFFKRLAEIAGEHLKKGSKIYVEGELRNRKWQDDAGIDRYITEVVVFHLEMLGSRVTEPSAAVGDSTGSLDKAGVFDDSPHPPHMGDYDDDIPF